MLSVKEEVERTGGTKEATSAGTEWKTATQFVFKIFNWFLLYPQKSWEIQVYFYRQLFVQNNSTRFSSSQNGLKEFALKPDKIFQ